MNDSTMNTGLANDPYNRFNDGDPCANKHGGNAESRAAWDKVSPGLKESQEVIYNLIKSVAGRSHGQGSRRDSGQGLQRH
jgi:hypothetical protein